MTESEFLALAEQTLGTIERAIERAADDADADIECSRSGNVLDIEFGNRESKIIVNSQAAMHEIWVAARAGGFHYRYDGAKWINTRDGSELFDALSQLATSQAGTELKLQAA
jgi:CyaY protein